MLIALSRPIVTYKGLGCRESRFCQEDHAIIYTSPEPVSFTGEERITKKPIKVKTYGPRHELDRASRLNYAKIYTIEYSVGVCFIGEIRMMPFPALLYG